MSRLLWLVGLVGALEVPPKFDLDLRKAPEERWTGALDLVLSRHPFAFSFGPVFAEHNRSLFDHLSPAHFERIALAVSKHYPETALELQGIAKDFAAHGYGVSFQYLCAWLYFHELAHSDAASSVEGRECTGLVAETTGNGVVMQLANMDQSPLAARNLTLQVRVLDRAGDLLFQGVDWYTLLSTGVSRAVKRGVASVQENWRSDGVRKLEDVVKDIESGVISQMLVFRRAFENPEIDNFEVFLASVGSTVLAAPYYVVAAGAQGQGVAMARNLTAAVRADRLEQTQDFYLVQCNTDRWVPDDPTDPRRTAAEKLLKELGKEEATAMGLFAVISAYPVHNPHTAYTAVMSAATGELHAYVREASCPVDPYASVVMDRRYCLKQPRILTV